MASLVVFASLLCALPLINAAALPGSNPCTWGPSYWCKNVNQAEECNSVDFCVEKQWRNSTAGMLGGDKCTQGPAYWCSGEDTISECGAEEYCARVATAAPKTNTTEPIGSNKCTWGPSYWCSSLDSATECGMLDHCQEVWDKAATAMPQLAAEAAASTESIGGDKCTWGPAYWCSGADTANACNASKYCKTEWQATKKPTV